MLLAVTFGLTLVTSFYDYQNEHRAMREHVLSFGRSLARQGALACPDMVVVSDEPALKAYVDDFVVGERYVALAAVIRADGKILACSPSGALERADAWVRQIESPILIERGGERLGNFVLGVSFLPMDAEFEAKWWRMLLRTSLGFLLAGALVWVALKRLVLHPLNRLDGVAQRLGRGELYDPVPDMGGTEFGRLGRTMDQMRSNLQQSHRSLAAQNRRLLELDRLKTQFLANVSHEMRTPLTSVLGGLELLMESEDEPARREASHAVQRNGEQLLDLVDRLLDLAKLEDGNLLVSRRPCHPDRLITDLVERFREQAAAKGLTLRADVGAVVGAQASIDPARFRQVLSALVDNAVKFTSAGSVEVSARWVGAGGRRALEVEVVDTGPGIPVDFLPRMFEPFSQADGSLTRQHGGTGLGLSMAQRIAACLGGDITVENRRDGGVRARVRIDAPEVTEPGPQSLPGAAQEKARILVVDDAPDNQRLLRAFLTKAGYEVELAANGREAVDAVAAGRFDLVLMDLQMPVMDGVSAIRELRERSFRLPIVALTAHAMAQDQQGCLQAGANAYETKPISGARLVDVVRRQLSDKAE